MLTQELTQLIDHYLLFLHYNEVDDAEHTRPMLWTVLADFYTLIGAGYPNGWHPALIRCMKENPVRVEPPATRWECRCHEPAVLLGTVDEYGVNLKVRDRTYTITGGQVRAVCPRCGASHTITVPAVR